MTLAVRNMMHIEAGYNHGSVGGKGIRLKQNLYMVYSILLKTIIQSEHYLIIRVKELRTAVKELRTALSKSISTFTVL